MPTIKLYTLGCKVNQYETQAIAGHFQAKGYRILENGKPVDTCLINTCTVTSRADTKSRNLIRYAIKENPRARIIVTGCLIKDNIAEVREIKGISLIIPKSFFKDGIEKFSGHTRAFLKVQDGCNNSCSYCKVPLARGRSRSRLPQDIICEARSLVSNGFKEIVLCGICLGAFGRDLIPRIDLVDLIKELEKIDGLLRIRLSSIEAGDVSGELIERMGESKKLCPHLHIPMQSGDDKILKNMQRRYARKDYLNLVQKIKRRIPKIAITTDILVGFPGEDKNGFWNTVKLLRKITPLKTHIFPFSPRPGTPAFNFKNRPGADIVKERIRRLKEISDTCSLKYLKRFLNHKMPVLIEGKSYDGLWEGYTDSYIRIRVRSKQNLQNRLAILSLKKIEKNLDKANSFVYTCRLYKIPNIITA